MFFQYYQLIDITKRLMSQHKHIQSEQIVTLTQLLKDSPYKPISKISYGSFGQIFKIQDSKQQYALKVISKQRMNKQCKLHEAVIEGFVLSKMNHPGVVKYYQTIETKQYVCQVLEYCPYGDLFNVFKKINKNIDLVQRKKQIALFYLAQILDGLSHIHSKNIIHRDLKLENIVMASDLNIRIIDFGTAKPVKMDQFYTKNQVQFIEKLRNKKNQNGQQEITRTKSFVGSANYLSPESISLQYSLASDIWSFGILAYKMFHGKLPFQGENNFQIFKKIKENEIVINQKIEPQVQDLIRKCLKLNPTQRPTCAQLKKHPYFKTIIFQQLFKKHSPISNQAMKKMFASTNTGENFEQKKIDYEVVLEKKMFFGNYKPRILKVYRKGQGLYMSYWYLDGKAPKNEFELMINDYAQAISKTQFDVCNRDVKYTFKVTKNSNVDTVVNCINTTIKRHYDLE